MIKVKRNGRGYVVTYNGKRLRLISNETRAVYGSEKLGIVVKIDKDDVFEHDDEKVMKRIRKKDRAYFVPIINSSYADDGRKWIAQPFVEVIKVDDYNETIEKLERKYRLNDIHFWNYTLDSEGNPLIFDYGLV